MPKPASFKAVFSAPVMARDMIGLYRDILISPSKLAS